MAGGLDAPQEGRCSARLRGERKGKFCSSIPVKGRNRCKMHGGMSPPAGPGHHSFKHGRDSKWTKALGQYGKLYKDAVDSDELLDLRRQLAVMDVAIQRHAARVEELDTPDFRKKALELFAEYEQAPTDEEARARLAGIKEHLRRGAGEDRAFAYLVKTADSMARRIEAAYGLKLKSDEVVNQNELTRVTGALVSILVEEAPTDVATRVIQRADSELFAGGIGATGSRAGGDQTGRSVGPVQEVRGEGD
jgi:hypothetical protein